MSRKVQSQEAFKLALSLMLFYWLALYMDWNLPKFGALAIVVTSLSSSGASFNKGVMRVVGTGVGALAGFVLLSWFAQSPLGMLLAVAVYLVFIGYFLQTSRQADTWFNAGFLAVAVWSSSYMKVDTAFHFATNRFLETAAGVLLFTLVSALLWPRTSQSALQQQGQALWEDLQKLCGLYRRQLAEGTADPQAAGLRTRLAGSYQQLLGTLEAAYYDTPGVRAQKHNWERLRVDLRRFSNTCELWRESIGDCRTLDLHALLPGLAAALDTLQQRLQQGGDLWRLPSSASGETDTHAPSLQADLVLDIDTQAGAQLTHFERAALMNFITQLRTLDHYSRDLLLTLHRLAHPETVEQREAYRSQEDPFQPSAWNPERLLKATFPALCWISGYLFWIYVEPPGGPGVPMIATAFGLMMLMTPANLPALLLVLLLSMFVAVAPIYMFVMPALDSGFGLLALVFIYSFVFAWLGGISPVLKLGPLTMFVMMVDINNDQVYSFILLVTAGLVMLLGVSIVVVVHRLLSPMHPEKILLRNVRRFCNGCARIVGEFQPGSARRRSRQRKLKKRVFESTILPVAAQLPALEKNLDYAQFPDNDAKKVQGLVDGLQSVRYRLQNLETIHNRVAEESPGLLQSLTPVNDQWRQRVQQVFRNWARLETADALPGSWADETVLSRQVEQHLAATGTGGNANGIEARDLQNLYALAGSTQSLLDAMQELAASMKQINWEQWAVARF
ncbi:MAG TPA: hypothetical protein ENK49_13745 [Gammaproteobacteria bacterium]|nr:hypothetical protein [Gammaproteobacteria bacterium]